MKIQNLFAVSAIVLLTACGSSGGAEGDACTSDADCNEGLECHDHDGEMECEAGDHDDHTDDSDA